ncbi:23S ribosomal RNA methyltransferase [Ceratobasidium sp. AG-I]|nr:23S ribosomal RNA methyltransferase [Ceratobasidium sp. AG-I]
MRPPSNLFTPARHKSTKSSKNWLARQGSDPFVKQRAGGLLDGTVYRARSAFKLAEINDRYNVLRPGMVVCDLGAAPGGWSQVAAKELRIRPPRPVPGSSEGSGAKPIPEDADPPRPRLNRPSSMLVAVDILSTPPIPGVHILQGDFTSPRTQQRLSDLVGDRGVDVILSDMCANVSGTARDTESSLELCETAFAFASRHLKSGERKSGTLVMKYFEHSLLLDFMKERLKPAFHNVRTLRLAASRSESSEQYFLCTGFRGS